MRFFPRSNMGSTKTFTKEGDTTNYDDNWKQTVDAHIDINSQMLNVLDHLGGNVLDDENHITLPQSWMPN